MTNSTHVHYCLDRCGNVLVTSNEIIGGICEQCLNGVTISDENTYLWELVNCNLPVEHGGFGEHERVDILVEANLASIWPDAVFNPMFNPMRG